MLNLLLGLLIKETAISKRGFGSELKDRAGISIDRAAISHYCHSRK